MQFSHFDVIVRAANMSEWFSKLAEDALKFVDDVADNITEKITSATDEIEVERNKLVAEKSLVSANTFLLPWETDNEEYEILSQDVMEKVFQLSLSESNFTIAPKKVDDLAFDFNAFVPVIMKVLKFDANLARIHAKLIVKMEEKEFWRNYYYRTQYWRASIGLDGPEGKSGALGTLKPHEVVIYEPEALADASSISEMMVRTPLKGRNADTSIEPSPIDSTLKASSSNENVNSPTMMVNEEELTEEEKEKMALEKRRKEEAALAAEVEAELLNEDVSGLLDEDIDLDDLGDLNLGGDDDSLDAEIREELGLTDDLDLDEDGNDDLDALGASAEKEE